MGLLSSIFSIFNNGLDSMPEQALIAEDEIVKTGLRVQVKSVDDGKLYFIAELIISKSGIELYQESNLSESFIGNESQVLIRAFDSSEKKVIRLNGTISSDLETGIDMVWKLRDISISSIGDDREFYRQVINAPAFIIVNDRTPIDCTVLNISSGGIRVKVLGARYNVGDKMVVSIPLIANTVESPLVCSIRNVSDNEYGCKFNKLDALTADQIAKKILEIQFSGK